jgi:hypothetical protein
MEDFSLFNWRKFDNVVETSYIPHIQIANPQRAVHPPPPELVSLPQRYYYFKSHEDPTPIYPAKCEKEIVSENKLVKNIEVKQFKGRVLVRNASIHAQEPAHNDETHKKAKQIKRKNQGTFLKSNFVPYCSYLKGCAPSTTPHLAIDSNTQQ